MPQVRRVPTSPQGLTATLFVPSICHGAPEVTNGSRQAAVRGSVVFHSRIPALSLLGRCRRG